MTYSQDYAFKTPHNLVIQGNATGTHFELNITFSGCLENDILLLFKVVRHSCRHKPTIPS
jgi:hypothetical protein